MSLYKRTGDRAMKLCDEFRKTDPKLENPIKHSLVSLFEWAFPDALIRSMKEQKQDRYPDRNDPN